jgi:hypothetical protein
LARSEQGEALERGVWQFEPRRRNARRADAIDTSHCQPRIPQQLDQRHPVAESPVLPVGADRGQIPMGAVAALVGLTQLAQEIQRIAQQ